MLTYVFYYYAILIHFLTNIHLPLYQYIHSTNNHVYIYIYICTMYRYNYKLLYNNVTRTMYLVHVYLHVYYLIEK